MGRGLSKLQRYILEQAASRERVHVPEILVGFFGWKTSIPSPSKLTPGERPPRVCFSRRDIGATRYRSVMASVSRSIRKLEERELIQRREYAFLKMWAIRITDKGRERLSISRRSNYWDINR